MRISLVEIRGQLSDVKALLPGDSVFSLGGKHLYQAILLPLSPIVSLHV